MKNNAQKKAIMASLEGDKNNMKGHQLYKLKQAEKDYHMVNRGMKKHDAVMKKYGLKNEKGGDKD